MIDELKEYFGFSSFRPFQKEIIQSVLDGQDTLALMPTGGGKSICYQLPALMLDGMAVVISPLIALMKDQVDALKINGISAEFINSSLSASDQSSILYKAKTGQLKLLYLAPERLFSSDNFLQELKNIKISMFAIDEAHCISQWGHDFRPEYMQLSGLKNDFPELPIIALTATADERTRGDIKKNLGFSDANVFISSFNRPNIHYKVLPKQNSRLKLMEYLMGRKEDSGIIYVLSRKSTESVAMLLRENGFSAIAYHAGLSREEREINQNLFVRDEVKIVVATIAFGMGIDKSNVRFVVHLDLPKNIEGYYQETGRAGRDGLSSDALLFFSRADAIQLKKFIEVDGNTEQTAVMHKKLNEMVSFAESNKCRRQYLLNYFNEEHSGDCGSCDNCLTEFSYFDGSLLAQKALSAVSRLNESFGINYVIDFLRGSKSEKIKSWHREIKTFGVGKDVSKANWQKYFRNFIDEGILEVSTGKYPILKLTSKSREVLKGKTKVMLVEQENENWIEETEEMEQEHDLLLALKQLRRKMADRENVPPYLIFSDATLVELSTYLPLNSSDLLGINGFGEIKIKKYGQEFLKLIQEYLSSKQLESRMHLKPKLKIPALKKKKSIKTPTKEISYKMYEDGLSIPEIAENRKLNVQTIENHLMDYIKIGKVALSDFISTDKIPPIEKALKEHSGMGLKIVKDVLGENYSYSEIKAVQSNLIFKRDEI